MEKSDSIKIIAGALLNAQKAMGNAIKDSNNPFFKSKYADLNSVREACMPHLNANGIVVLQPTIEKNGRPYVETILIHESGEFISSVTEIICNKINDAQSHGSGLTYARRYGLQSMVNIGADDDDGNAAVKPATNNNPDGAKPFPSKDQFEKLIAKVNAGEADVLLNAEKYYRLTKDHRDLLNKAIETAKTK